MKLEIAHVAVVVLGNQYSPSAINPNFLESQEIVGEDWELSEAPISTPFLSTVRYTNGISFVTELDKVQVIHNEPNDLFSSSVAEIAERYILKFPHFRYIAVGINVLGFIKYEMNVEQMLIDKFLNPELVEKDSLNAIAVKLVYPLSNVTLNLTCEPGTFSPHPQNETYQGILLNANYHTNLPTDVGLQAGLESAIRAISIAPSHYEHYSGLVNKFFDLEVE